MPTMTYAGTDVEVNDEGFFVDANQWTKEMAPEIAAQVGVPTPLTDDHWKVIDLMRTEYFDKGTGPTVRKIGKMSDVSTKELFALFPKGPAKLAAMVAGIPKPRGCI
jgi:dissimilatory sulfite reductase related protein